MTEITIPDTPEFQSKALKVATTYNRWATMQFVNKLQEGKGKKDDFSLDPLFKDLDENYLAYMELSGYSADKLKDKHIYGKEGPIGYGHHNMTMSNAVDEFLAARQELFDCVKKDNPEPRSQHSGYTKMFSPGNTHNDELQKELSQKVSLLALNNGFHVPQQMNYFFAAPAISMN